MSDLLSIGSSGLRAYRDALATTSDNIANAQTAGYVRRTLRLEEVAASGNSPLLRAAVSPGGVQVAGVQRAVDQWIVENSRTSISNAGRSAARLDWLEASERALGDGVHDVGTAATAMFNAADTLAPDPGNQTLRLAFLQSVETATSAFRTTAGELESVSTGIASAAEAGVAQANADLVALQRVNTALLRAREGSTSQASLLDDRDRLLDSLSQALPVSATFNAQGAATVHLIGSGNPVLVAGPTIGAVQLNVAADGRLSLQVGGNVVQPGAGSLAGLISAAASTAAQRATLDDMAGRFAEDLNNAHQTGLDANGNAGGPLVSFSGSALTLTAVALSANQVAAAAGNSENGNLLGLAGLRGPAGVEEGWNQLVAVHAQIVSAARAEDAAAANRREGALQARSELSSIDLDREAAELLRFQQAYEASARVIQVAREAFQSILNAI